MSHNSLLVVVFDDIQWGEETFRDLIEHVALLSTGASVLLLCMARSELTEKTTGGETHFADMYGAYERLAPAWKDRIVQEYRSALAETVAAAGRPSQSR
jgi:alpha-ketoglutarate-dependent taurine dioxygenase